MQAFCLSDCADKSRAPALSDLVASLTCSLSTLSVHGGNSAVGSNSSASNKVAECKSIDAQISEFAAMTRRP